MQLTDITFPPFVKKVTRLLPRKPSQYSLVFSLNQLLKKNILQADMSLLAGKQFEIVIDDLGLVINFTANEHKFLVSHYTTEPDLRFTATMIDFTKMILRKEDPDTLFFNRKLQIEGDTELGLIIKNLLDNIDWSTVPIMKSIIG
ncbi:ubiquinone anaerobic biosynthesis accessory factor UbiT [Entomomonas asaccharolytica]|uniref:Ubiquinone biosynthesis accessory factor UbiT n=1 Tax=Entomomonas asaccharolytica TaxID=2785331 RepID=A0A974NDH5_9GAMM|nr:SCP2 sterol-binding domain-containing protein [Entomomonas asaccharolytica]QQP84676.1 SCP2 sterol-binding domain-containing protein [Entomomonas asaccharolytica]